MKQVKLSNLDKELIELIKRYKLEKCSEHPFRGGKLVIFPDEKYWRSKE